MTERERIETAVRDTLGGDARISTVVLFGSFARGSDRAKSDVDLAYRLAHRVDDALFRRDEMQVLGGLVLACRRDVHLVDLDRAGLTLRVQVFRYGQVLWDREPDATSRLREATLIAWFDWEVARREHDRYLDGRLGIARRG